MLYRSALLAAVAAVLVTGHARANSLDPIQAQHIEAGVFAGVAYYTVEPEGYRLVATLMANGTKIPVRFIATLAPEQSVTLSVPRGVNEPATEVHFTRHGEHLLVDGDGTNPTIGEDWDY